MLNHIDLDIPALDDEARCRYCGGVGEVKENAVIQGFDILKVLSGEPVTGGRLMIARHTPDCPYLAALNAEEAVLEEC